jgi:hypothetical protein
MDRTFLIKQIQFILFDEYDENPTTLNTRYYSGYYNQMSDKELLNYYYELKNDRKNLQYQ